MNAFRTNSIKEEFSKFYPLSNNKLCISKQVIIIKIIKCKCIAPYSGGRELSYNNNLLFWRRKLENGFNIKGNNIKHVEKWINVLKDKTSMLHFF